MRTIRHAFVYLLFAGLCAGTAGASLDLVNTRTFDEGGFSEPPEADASVAEVLANGDFDNFGWARSLRIAGSPDFDDGASDSDSVSVKWSFPGRFPPIEGLDIEQIDLVDASEIDDQFGESVASADFNGDCVDDLAIGIPGEDASSGALVMILGGADVVLIEDFESGDFSRWDVVTGGP